MTLRGAWASGTGTPTVALMDRKAGFDILDNWLLLVIGAVVLLAVVKVLQLVLGTVLFVVKVGIVALAVALVLAAVSRFRARRDP